MITRYSIFFFGKVMSFTYIIGFFFLNFFGQGDLIYMIFFFGQGNVVYIYTRIFFFSISSVKVISYTAELEKVVTCLIIYSVPARVILSFVHVVFKVSISLTI